MFIRVAVPKSLADIATTMFSFASKLLTKLNTILRWRERDWRVQVATEWIMVKEPVEDSHQSERAQWAR